MRCGATLCLVPIVLDGNAYDRYNFRTILSLMSAPTLEHGSEVKDKK